MTFDVILAQMHVAALALSCSTYNTYALQSWSLYLLLIRTISYSLAGEDDEVATRHIANTALNGPTLLLATTSRCFGSTIKAERLQGMLNV